MAGNHSDLSPHYVPSENIQPGVQGGGEPNCSSPAAVSGTVCLSSQPYVHSCWSSLGGRLEG